MKAEKIVYDHNDTSFGLAVFDANGLMEIDIYSENRAVEGNVYLGKIVKKINILELIKKHFIIYIMNIIKNI